MGAERGNEKDGFRVVAFQYVFSKYLKISTFGKNLFLSFKAYFRLKGVPGGVLLRGGHKKVYLRFKH